MTLAYESNTADSQVQRADRRFALVAAAAELARLQSLTDWESAD